MPYLASPAVFEDEVREAKSKYLNSEKEYVCASSSTSKEQAKKQKARLNRLDKLLSFGKPKSPTLVLGSVLLTEEDVVGLGLPAGTTSTVSPSMHLEALSHAWGSVFGHKSTAKGKALKLIRTYCKNVTWNWSLTQPPTLSTAEEWLARARDSSPGWDGIPNSAWKATGKKGSQMLHRSVDSQLEGDLPPPGFNIGVWCFPPKKAPSY